MNYVRFLKHHAPIAELIDEVDEPTEKSFSTINENSVRVSSNRSPINEVYNKLRQKVNIFQI
jgi:hypothetical protein